MAARKPVRRKNSEADEAAQARALTEEFHGRPARRTQEVEETYDTPTQLADLGRLVQLLVWLDEDHPVELRFSGNVRVACTGDGGSLYFVGGDQRLNLERLGRADYLPKDRVTIGAVEKIVYHTSKAFHDFEPVEYEHEFGEEGGELPILGYDTRNKRLYLDGGSYRVLAAGIVN